MWLTPSSANLPALRLESTTSFAPDIPFDNPEFMLLKTLQLSPREVTTPPRCVRLSYGIEQMAVAVKAGTQTVREVIADVRGASLEITITERDGLTVARNLDGFEPEVRAWLEDAVEEVRSFWALPPVGAQLGDTWTQETNLPVSLPHPIRKFDVSATSTLTHLELPGAEIDTAFNITITNEPLSSHEGAAITGQQRVRLHQHRGIERALKKMVIRLTGEDATGVATTTCQIAPVEL